MSTFRSAFLLFIVMLSTLLTSNGMAVVIKSSLINDYANTLSKEEVAELSMNFDSFPWSSYRLYNVPDLGYFYLDDLDDGIKNWLRQGIKWEDYITKILRFWIKPNTVAIDIGAHIGTHTLSMSKYVGNRGLVLAFEPQKKLFRELFFNMQVNHANNIKLFRFALGDQHKTVQMNSSVPGNEGGTGIGIGGDSVEMRTLDSFNLNNVSCIKIDVEGFENAVLDGAYLTIMRNRPVIVIEIMGGCNYDTASEEIRKKIEYTLEKLNPFNYLVKRISSHDYLAIPKR